MQGTTITKPLGRPRDDAASPALLQAARKLVIELGYEGVSIGLIASEAGVSRQTIYRRWSSKADLVLDAFFDNVSRTDEMEDQPLPDALLDFLRKLFMNLETDGPAIRSLIASAQSDAVFLAQFKDEFTRPRALVVRNMIERAIERNEVRKDADVETATETIHGAFWYRLLQSEPLDIDFARRLVAFAMLGLSK